MLKKILGCHCSTAHKTDDRLILSLTDAITPAMWVINLSDNPSLLLKVEESDNNLYVLQKITSDGKTTVTEELGYYAKKGHAINAMDKATRALDNSKGVGAGLWCFGKMIIGAAVVVFLLSQILQSNVSFSGLLSFVTAPFETSATNNPAETTNEAAPNAHPQNVTPHSC